jgi:hypothetical protein
MNEEANMLRWATGRRCELARRIKSALLPVTAVLLGTSSTLAFAETSTFTVVLDMTPSASEAGAANRAFPLGAVSAETEALLERFADGTAVKADELQLFTTLTASVATTSTRWISSRGSRLIVYAVYDGKTQAAPRVSIKEEARKTQLSQDLATLLKIVKKISGLETLRRDRSPSALRAHRTEYLLTRVRSQLTVAGEAVLLDPKESSGQPNAVGQVVLLTGPAEHFFLSADLPITKASQLKYDNERHQLVNRDEPSTFYVGLDYILGDLLSDRRPVMGGIVLKGLLKIAKQPLDSYGAAIGYRFTTLKTAGFELDGFSPFVGYIWTKEDELTDAGAPQRESHYRGSVRAGISLNLDKALDWVK